jgi:hypothetical protein
MALMEAVCTPETSISTTLQGSISQKALIFNMRLILSVPMAFYLEFLIYSFLLRTDNP